MRKGTDKGINHYKLNLGREVGFIFGNENLSHTTEAIVLVKVRAEKQNV